MIGAQDVVPVAVPVSARNRRIRPAQHGRKPRKSLGFHPHKLYIIYCSRAAYSGLRTCSIRESMRPCAGRLCRSTQHRERNQRSTSAPMSGGSCISRDRVLGGHCGHDGLQTGGTLATATLRISNRIGARNRNLINISIGCEHHSPSDAWTLSARKLRDFS